MVTFTQNTTYEDFVERIRPVRADGASAGAETPASRPRPAPTVATSRACCSLTGYAGDVAAKALALRCRAVDALTEAGRR